MLRSKHLLPIFDPSIIKDHNVEGFDSVDSEDFDPGYGCVPVYVERPVPEPPPVKSTKTESDCENEKYFFMTAEEKDKANDEYLKHFGL